MGITPSRILEFDATVQKNPSRCGQISCFMSNHAKEALAWTEDLTSHDFATLDAAGSIARVNHQLAFLHNAAKVIVGVVRHDDDAVILPKIVEIGTLHLEVVLPASSDEREIGIVLADLRSGQAERLPRVE